jgi:hypothetical protein
MILQNEDSVKQVSNTDLLQIFENVYVPIFKGKAYKFELDLLLKDNSISYTDLFFGMIGDLEFLENIRYFSKSSDFENTGVVEKNYNQFNKSIVSKDIATENVNLRITGSFNCNGNGFIKPAIAFNFAPISVTVKKGSYFEISEI